MEMYCQKGIIACRDNNPSKQERVLGVGGVDRYRQNNGEIWGIWNYHSIKG